jgi:membrane protein YdbS with pleckstrin-like domain
MANPKRKMARLSWIISGLGLFLILVPMKLGWVEGMKGGFALAAFGVLITVAGLATFFVYGKLARQWDSVISGQNVLIHWTYSPDLWRDYVRKDYNEDKKNKMGLFFVISAFAVFFGLLFFLMDRKAGFIVLLIMIGLIIILRLTVFLSSRFIYWQNRKAKGEAFITPTAVLLNKQLHAWGSLGSTLEGVKFRPGRPALIEFGYSAPSGRAMASYSVRVPVPPGQEEAAQRVIEYFREHP